LQPTEPVDPRTVIRRRAVPGFAAAICMEVAALAISRFCPQPLASAGIRKAGSHADRGWQAKTGGGGTREHCLALDNILT
jgi:hypothetical protein